MTTIHDRPTARELDAMPVLAEGQADNLHIDNEDGVRIWLSRCGLEDGEPFENTVTVEAYNGNRWETVATYDGGQL